MKNTEINKTLNFARGTIRYIYLTSKTEELIITIKNDAKTFGYIIDPYISITDNQLRVDYYIEARNKEECRATINDFKTSCSQYGKFELIKQHYGVRKDSKYKFYKNYIKIRDEIYNN